MRLFVWATLMFNLAVCIGWVWVFWWLVNGGTIVPDSRNLFELMASVVITGMTVTAVIVTAEELWRRPK